jgi:tRNA pseudouridine(38-40) synthase
MAIRLFRQYSVLRRIPDILGIHPLSCTPTPVQKPKMTEDTSTTTLGSTKRCCDQDTSQSSPKRVKGDIDIQSTTGANPPNLSPDTPQGSKKSQKRRDAAGYAKSRQGREKDSKNIGRRRRDGPETSGAGAGAVPSEADPRDVSEKAPRLPKRQSAILLGFCGTGCAGMQMLVCCNTVPEKKGSLALTILFSQPDTRTIEGVLFDALVRVGAVSSDNADDPTKVSLGRAARTDAGVHAAGNLVSLKLITQIPGVPDVVGAINRSLPPEIRVWGIIRVQNSFNARTCVFRSPKCIFAPYGEAIDLAIVASTRTFSLPTSSYPPSPAVACTKHSAARQYRHRAAQPTLVHLLTTFIHFGPSLPPSHQRRTIYKGSVDGVLNQKRFRDYGKAQRSSRALATSTTSQ